MGAPRTEMHQLQELVRLYRLGCTVRDRTRLLQMSSRTEGQYRRILAQAGLLEGAPADIPELEVLRAAVLTVVPEPKAPAVEGSADPWMDEIQQGLERGAGPTAIWDRLRRTDPEFSASLSAVKRGASRIRRATGVRPEDVVIGVETGPGEVAQVDFGFAGRFFDDATGRIRKAWIFVMVLALGTVEDLDDAALRQITSRPDYYYRTAEVASLTAIYEEIAGEIQCSRSG